jgi:hypothetical protein
LARPSSSTGSSNGLPRQPTRLTRGRLLAGLLVLFAAGVLAAVLDLRFAIGGSPRRVEPHSLLVLDARTMATLRNPAGEQGPGPPKVVRGAGLVWTLDPRHNKLVATDPVARRVVRTEIVGTQPVAVAIGFHAAWVANSGNSSVTYVPLTSEKLEAIGLDWTPTAIATGAGYVWVISMPGHVVLRIDPKTKQVDKNVRLANPPLDVAVRAGQVLLTIGG